MLIVSFWGEKKALHLLKGRQYSIMCQNRIRGLLKPQPCQRKMLYFAYAANLFYLSPSSYTIICTVCVCVCMVVFFFFLAVFCLMFQRGHYLSLVLSVLDREKKTRHSSPSGLQW